MAEDAVKLVPRDEANRRDVIATLDEALAEVRSEDFVGVEVIAWRSDGSVRELATPRSGFDVVAILEIVKQAAISRYFAARPPKVG